MILCPLSSYTSHLLIWKKREIRRQRISLCEKKGVKILVNNQQFQRIIKTSSSKCFRTKLRLYRACHFTSCRHHRSPKSTSNNLTTRALYSYGREKKGNLNLQDNSNLQLMMLWQYHLAPGSSKIWTRVASSSHRLRTNLDLAVSVFRCQQYCSLSK